MICITSECIAFAMSHTSTPSSNCAQPSSCAGAATQRNERRLMNTTGSKLPDRRMTGCRAAGTEAASNAATKLSHNSEQLTWLQVKVNKLDAGVTDKPGVMDADACPSSRALHVRNQGSGCQAWPRNGDALPPLGMRSMEAATCDTGAETTLPAPDGAAAASACGAAPPPGAPQAQQSQPESPATGPHDGPSCNNEPRCADSSGSSSGSSGGGGGGGSSGGSSSSRHLGSGRICTSGSARLGGRTAEEPTSSHACSASTFNGCNAAALAPAAASSASGAGKHHAAEQRRSPAPNSSSGSSSSSSVGGIGGRGGGKLSAVQMILGALLAGLLASARPVAGQDVPEYFCSTKMEDFAERPCSLCDPDNVCSVSHLQCTYLPLPVKRT